MSRVITLLILVVALALAKAVLVSLAIAAGLALGFAFLRRPRETLLFLGALALTGLATAQPTAAIIGLTIVCITALLRRPKPAAPEDRSLKLGCGRRSG